MKRLFSVLSLVLISSIAKAKSEMKKTIPPGKIHEECMELKPSQKLVYSFEANGSLDFNIHFHVGDAVEYPVKKDKIKKHNDVFRPTLKQDYCLMWTNKSKAPVILKYQVQTD